MKIDKDTIYYAIMINLMGLHNGLYRLKWDDYLEGFWDKKRDNGIDLKAIKRLARGAKQNATGYIWLIYETKAEAQVVHDALSTYRDHLKDLM